MYCFTHYSRLKGILKEKIICTYFAGHRCSATEIFDKEGGKLYNVEWAEPV
jgi:hypothetical protein